MPRKPPAGATAKRAAPRRLKVREFLEGVREESLQRLGPALGEPQSRIRFATLQIHFGRPATHYEVWLVRKTGRIEIGLHIEGPSDWSRAFAHRLAARADLIRSALGPGYELEDWTASWCRLHETLSYTPLTADLQRAVTRRLICLMQAMEPILADLPVPAAPARSGRRRHAPRRRPRSRIGGGRG